LGNRFLERTQELDVLRNTQSIGYFQCISWKYELSNFVIGWAVSFQMEQKMKRHDKEKGGKTVTNVAELLGLRLFN
jgi:hypothetical protein